MKPSPKTLAPRTLMAAVLLCGLSVPVQATPVQLQVAAGKPLMRADRPSKNYLKIGLSGHKLKAGPRVPLNLALVLDRSGSMQGTKMNAAKQAAELVVRRLHKDDIISIIAYDSGVEVVVPATKAHDKQALFTAIRRLQPRGSTALFAGVSTGLAEVRKFMDERHVNRVILLSDGQANVGPNSPNELALLGASAGKEGVSVTTIGLGLGYNEDLMARLAKASDGNHAFVESATQLAQIFEYELGDVTSVVAQEVSVKVKLPAGVRPIQILGRDGEINGQEVFVAFNQLYGDQDKYFLLEVEVNPGRVGQSMRLADVSVSYADMISGETVRLNASEGVSFDKSLLKVTASENTPVMVAAVEALAVRVNRQAVALRDKGQVQQARQVLNSNAVYLQKNAVKYKSVRLDKYRVANEEDAQNLEGQRWNKRRKSMRKTQHTLETRQSY